MRDRSTRFAHAWAGALLVSVSVSACGAPSGAFDAIPDASQRLVATPSSVAVLSQAHTTTGLPSEVTFGDASGRSALYLEFSPEWRAHGAPLKGFVALEPRLGEARDAEPVTVEVWRVRSAWQPRSLHTWSDKPELGPPFARAVISSSPAHGLRIDITELLRFAADNPAIDHGIALIARGGSGHGASFATGIGGGSAPRLEVYTR
jgi:hypothetical protein